MAAGPMWGSLPSIAVSEILSYLSYEDRFKVSSTCKRWRMCLFHPSLWHNITFDVSFTRRQKSRYLAERCGRFVREAVLRFNSHNMTEVRESSRILGVLSANKNLQYFSLQPSSCHVEWPENQSNFIDRYVRSIENVIVHSRKLHHFSLGYSEELLLNSPRFIELLGRSHGHSLSKLYLASVKEDSENYDTIELDDYHFQSFRNLTHISLDFDYLSNSILHSFVDRQKAKLQQMILHIHGVSSTHERITNASWRLLTTHHPELKVTLNLIHSLDGVVALLDILQPSMPLTHFRQFFCGHINSAAITYMSTLYRDSLESVYILDGLMEGYPLDYTVETDEDPFVMLAWRCYKLKHFTLIGYKISDDDVIAIARLRGNKLETFGIPQCSICTVSDDGEYDWMNQETHIDEFRSMVSENMSWSWRPIEDEELPMAVFDDRADAERAYMNILFSDQQ
ncbi:hypothetical protein FSP39_014870 [Pinctada imbricata]|uniref:F-box domain-containing protein n=1 Tax=Pinctada imbricata TaxID=66713 RepID=A0AA89C7G0_PINIB|nr:hypothetical protein FSP39_014870 [Pinctada imbricata]